MKEIIQYIKTNAYHYKTDKSLYNIIVGAKTHQTYFDACSQQLLSLYHSHPSLKYPSFERICTFLDEDNEKQNPELKISTRFTFESIQQTFQVIQLLIQTISNYYHHHMSFTPVSQISKVQERAKSIFYEIQRTQSEACFEKEVYQLFKHLSEVHSKTILHYFLQGYEETMYTNQQVSLIEGLPQNELLILKMNDLVEMILELEQSHKYKILHQTIILPVLSVNAYQTYQDSKKGLTMREIAQKENIKENTVEDHILELFIKGYFTNYQPFLDASFYNKFKYFYASHKDARLKVFKTEFPENSYFDIKLAIVRYSRGD